MSFGRFPGLPSRRAVWLLGLVLAFCFLAAAQEPVVPMVGFNLVFPGSQPDKYAIVIPATGNATYYSDGKLTSTSESDDFRVNFTISEATRTRVFDLAKRARYFDGEIDSKKKGLAFTGTKTLIYKDADKHTSASYNYSTIPAVQELTQLFQSLSTTLEFGRRLEYYHHYQKLALDDELKRMEEMAKQNNLQELSAVAPVLEQIATDSSVINPVRARAQRLLERAGVSP
jgi:hypothetical protein